MQDPILYLIGLRLLSWYNLFIFASVFAKFCSFGFEFWGFYRYGSNSKTLT